MIPAGVRSKTSAMARSGASEKQATPVGATASLYARWGHVRRSSVGPPKNGVGLRSRPFASRMQRSPGPIGGGECESQAGKEIRAAQNEEVGVLA